MGNVGAATNATLAAGETREVVANCPAATATDDYRATGGGFAVNTAEVQILASRQTLDGLGWRVNATNTTGIFQVVTAFVTCVRYRK